MLASYAFYSSLVYSDSGASQKRCRFRQFIGVRLSRFGVTRVMAKIAAWPLNKALDKFHVCAIFEQ
jgi:hypothetical protein